MLKIELEDLAPEVMYAIADRVIDKLKPLLSKSSSAEDIIFNVKGLSEYLKVQPKWIYEQTHFKQIPYVKLGNKQLRFSKIDIDKWIETKKTPVIEEITEVFKGMN
jgi:excisionase family DNA binding protein